MKDISDGICAYLRGGLGNQLFILAAAWSQAKRLDCPLYIDTSSFTHQDKLSSIGTPRNFSLSNLNIPGEIIGADSPWAYFSPARPELIRALDFRRNKLKVFREPGLDYCSDVDLVSPGTTLFGYFQSASYFRRISSTIAETLDNAMLNALEEKFLSKMSANQFLAIHLRRGDYLQAGNKEFHGLISSDYVNNARKILASVAGVNQGIVFSDSPDIARQELSHFSNIDFFELPQGAGDFSEMLAMSLGNSMVMSNSSYSWWAAWLGSERGNMRHIIAPRPWFEHASIEKDLLLPSWLTLDRRGNDNIQR